MIGGSADIDICKIPLSNDTIHRRIKDMSENIEQNTANSNFALQVDETTDITGNAQLIAFVRFIHENDIINQFLCCRELPDFTTGKHIFQVISSYLEEIKVSWKSCIGICTDGAPAMTEHLKGFVAHVKELNEDILVTHCFLHREVLVTKFLPSDLKIVLEQCVKMVNYIKSRPLKSRLFSKLCQAMEAKYESLLLHTELTSAEGLASAKKTVANEGDREGVGAKRRAIPYASKHVEPCICPICAANMKKIKNRNRCNVVSLVHPGSMRNVTN
ncbi:SCAN domain-containing protein 3 [Trichonephila clavipes]|nr:SCAN domain-containing protein 3 [Trichonephila clavipes]